jgi:hypothetical protein
LFFAGANHVALKVKASDAEHNLITTNPQEILRLRQEGKIGGTVREERLKNREVYKPVSSLQNATKEEVNNLSQNNQQNQQQPKQNVPNEDGTINPNAILDSVSDLNKPQSGTLDLNNKNA